MYYIRILTVYLFFTIEAGIIQLIYYAKLESLNLKLCEEFKMLEDNEIERSVKPSKLNFQISVLRGHS